MNDKKLSRKTRKVRKLISYINTYNTFAFIAFFAFFAAHVFRVVIEMDSPLSMPSIVQLPTR